MANPLGGLLRDGVTFPAGDVYVMWYNNVPTVLPWANNAGVVLQWYIG